MKKAVLFDMDGILYDSEGFYMDITVDVMRELGYTGPEEPIYAVVGTTADGTWKILYDLLEGAYTGNEIRQRWLARNAANPLDYRAVMFPDIPATLERLKQAGLRMACCSSNTPHVIARSLDAMGIRNYFDCVISSEDLERAKPDPMIYLKAAETLGVRPEECAVYEDSTPGILAGKRAGMTVYARKDVRFSQDQTRADRIIKAASELADHILEEEP
jgi:HAD superfamily hydrolase (TIGR01509 family)